MSSCLGLSFLIFVLNTKCWVLGCERMAAVGLSCRFIRFRYHNFSFQSLDLEVTHGTSKQVQCLSEFKCSNLDSQHWTSSARTSEMHLNTTQVTQNQTSIPHSTVQNFLILSHFSFTLVPLALSQRGIIPVVSTGVLSN